MKWIIKATKAVLDELIFFYTSLGYGMLFGFFAMFHWRVCVSLYSLFGIFCLIYWLLGGEIKTIFWLNISVPCAQFIGAIVIGLLATTAFSRHETDNIQ